MKIEQMENLSGSPLNQNGTKMMYMNTESLRRLQHYITHAVIFNTIVILLICYFYTLINGQNRAVMYISLAIQVILIVYVAAFICIIWSY